MPRQFQRGCAALRELKLLGLDGLLGLQGQKLIGGLHGLQGTCGRLALIDQIGQDERFARRQWVILAYCQADRFRMDVFIDEPLLAAGFRQAAQHHIDIAHQQGGQQHIICPVHDGDGDGGPLLLEHGDGFGQETGRRRHHRAHGRMPAIADA